jgi:phosphatidate cytidylyltransferase
MACVAVGLIVAGPQWFAGLALVIGVVLAWEWGRIVRGVDGDIVMVAHVCTVVAATVLAAMGQIALAMLATAIGLILVTLLSFGRHAVLSGLGVAFAVLPTVALIWFRSDPDFGMRAVLYVVAMVVVTDVAAYFSGRLIGGPKIWPRLSPKKTWAGLIGAMIATAAAGALFARWVPGAVPIKLAMQGSALAVIAQIGDFAESALKRKFGTKDASGLIPGHGGFMDRVDGLVTASVIAALFAAYLNVHSPARALLQW